MKHRMYFSAFFLLLLFCTLTQASVIKGEYFIDSDPGPGSGSALQAEDGSWDALFEKVMASAPVSGLQSGPHVLYIRLQKSDGTWSHAFGRIFTVKSSKELVWASAPKLADAEYFFDSDPGEGGGSALLTQDGNFDQLFESIAGSASFAGLQPGAHVLYVRLRNSAGQWGRPFGRVFRVNSREFNEWLTAPKLANAEYFFDTDPGEGSGFALLATDGDFNGLIENISQQISLAGLDETSHILFIRFRNENGKWSKPFGQVFTIDNLTPPEIPQNFAAAGKNGQVELSWSPNAENDLTGYVLYRSTTSGFEPSSADSIAAVSAPDTQYVDTDVINGDTYYYRLAAVDIAGNYSALCAEISATPHNSAPQIVQPFGDITVSEDAPVWLSGLIAAHFSDPDGDSLSFSVVSSDPDVIAADADSGRLRLAFPENAFGSAEVYVTASDGELQTTDTVNVTVFSVNDVPWFSGLPDTLHLTAGSQRTLILTEYAHDVEIPADSMVFEAAVSSSDLSTMLSISGDSLILSTAADQSSIVQLYLTVRDDSSAAGYDTINVYIEAPSGLYSPGMLDIPKTLVLEQNYPNPFNPATSIVFGLPKTGAVQLCLYNLLGEKIAVLQQGTLKAGYHTVKINASRFASGIYIYVLKSPQGIRSRKLILLK
ncbi:MAG: T9SS type A sorting domain-containing protein [Calditrichia bacterium]